MKLLDLNIKAVIFDLDGTLIDSTGIWHQIDVDFFARRKMNVPENYAAKIAHLGLKETAKFTKETYGIKETEDEIINEWKSASEDYYLYKLQLKPHAREILEFCRENELKIALATVNDKHLYEGCLKRLKIYKYFDYIVDVSIAKEGKASPKIYDCVSNYFGLNRDEVVVIEDISSSLITAKTSGYKTIGVHDLNSLNEENTKRKYSDIYVRDFNELY